MTQTYGAGYPFKEAVRSAADALLRVIGGAKKYVYMEDQYLVGNPELARALGRVLATNTNLRVIAVVTSLDISDLPQCSRRRNLFWGPLTMLYPDRVLVFERLGENRRTDGRGSYLHAKVTVVDDEACCAGSVNCNRRSWYHDSEVLVTVAGAAAQPGPVAAVPIATELRVARWAEHLAEKPDALADLRSALPRWSNLSPSARVRPWRPLPMPFLTGPENQFTAPENEAWNGVLDPPA